mmetsp:Transcript_91381/g.263106  ORF Transcript_91381/g.263106 Transcript_91381/m.263106 type:complete len:201 (-) Transcript_91381:975-1577(-)
MARSSCNVACNTATCCCSASSLACQCTFWASSSLRNTLRSSSAAFMRVTTSFSASSDPPATFKRACKSFTTPACRASVASSSFFMSANLISKIRLDSRAKAKDCWASDNCANMSLNCSSSSLTRGPSASSLACMSWMRWDMIRSSPAFCASLSAVAWAMRSSFRPEAATSSRLSNSCAPKRPSFAKCSASFAAELSSKSL